MSQILYSTLIACGGWLLLRSVKRMRRRFLGGRPCSALSVGTIHTLSRICSVAVVLLCLLLILHIIGFDMTPLLAFGGIGAAALGFAAKEVIANFFGGAMIHLTRPFTVGDMIILPSKEGVTGTVEDIGWHHTQIRDLDKRPVHLPNALFSEAVVVNMSHMSRRRILETIHLRAEDLERLPALLAELKTEIAKHPRIDTALPIDVVFNAFNYHALELLIDVYTFETRLDEYRLVKQEILLLAGQLIKAHNLEYAYPIFSQTCP